MSAEKIAAFEALTQKGMYERLRDEFPAQAVGNTRTKKMDLVSIYTQAAKHREDASGVPVHDGVRTGRLDSSKPNEGNTPKPDLPEVAGIEEMAAEGDPAVARRLPIREHAGLKFVIHKGDPERTLHRKEKYAIEDLAKFAPNLGPKYESAPKGTQGRRVWDPHKAERKRVRQAIYLLNCAEIQIKMENEQPAPLQERA